MAGRKEMAHLKELWRLISGQRPYSCKIIIFNKYDFIPVMEKNNVKANFWNLDFLD